nr:unnamed protein product [Digitaria exilis]
MADHQETTIHPATAATTGGGTGHGHGGDWWSTPVSCSPDHQLLPGFAGWSRSGANAASEESLGSNSLATGGSSITFQEPAAGVMPQPATGLAAGWNHPYYL